VWPWADAPADRPVHVFALRNEDAMKALAPKYWEIRDGIRPTSVYVTAPDRYYVALRSDVVADDRVGSANPYWGAYWSYSSVVIDRGLGRSMPLWLSRGLAGFMANTVVTDRSVQVGRISVPSLQLLGERGRIRLAEFLAADRQSPWFTQGDRLEMFDAQAGLFVHYLMFGDKGTHRDGSDRFIALIRDGRPAVDAFKTAFGDPQALENGFALYVRQPLSQFVSVPADTTIKRDTFSLRAIPAAESAAARAGFHAAMGREPDARALIAEANKLAPGIAAAHEAEGRLFDVGKNPDGARQSYGRAIEAGTSNFYTKYRWAALTWYRPDIDEATRARVREVLEDAVTVNDQYADSFVLLSEVRGRLGAAGAGVSAARTAVVLEPDEVYNRLALARALWNASARDEARKEAEQARSMAVTEGERRTVNDLIAFFEKAMANTPGSR
jgi:tetratricopeptide (TPR) repeat protein